MSNTNIIKKYSINIDFLDYEKKRDVTKCIVYSKGDVNTAFIYATLTSGNEIINLDGCIVTVNIENNEGEGLVNKCEILDANKGTISIPFSSNALSKTGFNKFEVVISSKDRQMVSPMFFYRVAKDILEDGVISGSNEYGILSMLLSQAQDILGETESLRDELRSLENEMKTNEVTRKENEENRERVFNEKTSIIDSKIQLADEKIEEIDYEISKIDEKVENKTSEIEEQIILNIDQKVDENFNDINIRINEKIDDLSQSIENANSKIEEMDLVIDESLNTVNSRVDEIDLIIDESVNTINSKVSEIEAVKVDFSNTIDNKLVELEDRFSNLESENPTGEIIQSRIDMDGVTHKTLAERLESDFNKKSNGKSIHIGKEAPTEDFLVWIDTSGNNSF